MRPPSAHNIFALIGPWLDPFDQRRKRRVRNLRLRAMVEGHARLMGVGIKPEREELSRESAQIDFSVYDRIGLVFVGQRERRFLGRRGRTIGGSLRREPHVDLLVDSRRKRLERNDADLSEFAVDRAGDTRAPPAPGYEAKRRGQGGDGRKSVKRRERLPLVHMSLNRDGLALARKGVDPHGAGEELLFSHKEFRGPSRHAENESGPP